MSTSTCARGASLVWKLSWPLMNSFNKTETDIFSMQAILHEDLFILRLISYNQQKLHDKSKILNSNCCHLCALTHWSKKVKQPKQMFDTCIYTPLI